MVTTRCRLLYLWKRLGTHCTRGWVDIETGQDRQRKSCLTGIRSAGCPARSESLYPLQLSDSSQWPEETEGRRNYMNSSTLCAFTKHYWTEHTVRMGVWDMLPKVLDFEDERIVNQTGPYIFLLTSNQPSPVLSSHADDRQQRGFLWPYFSLFGFHKPAGNLLTSLQTGSFSRRILLHAERIAIIIGRKEHSIKTFLLEIPVSCNIWKCWLSTV